MIILVSLAIKGQLYSRHLELLFFLIDSVFYLKKFVTRSCRKIIIIGILSGSRVYGGSLFC